MALSNQVRIIAGKWRGRKITFPKQMDLRPTPDRVRETVFNWLASHIPGAQCLDLFAGSGILGFEALSRGAERVVFVDAAKTVVQQLEKNVALLAVSNAQVIQAQLPQPWPQFNDQFDIVFLDPPFRQDLIAPCCQQLISNRLLKQDALIYIEVESELKQLPLPEQWQVYRHKIAGQVGYYLCRTTVPSGRHQ